MAEAIVRRVAGELNGASLCRTRRRALAENDMSSELSVWLDVLRLCSALVVVLGHAGILRFTVSDFSGSGTGPSRPMRWSSPSSSRGCPDKPLAGGASFSIYVVHYPAMHLMDAVLPEDLPGKGVLFVVLPVVFCPFFAAAFERTLPCLRLMAASLTKD